ILIYIADVYTNICTLNHSKLKQVGSDFLNNTYRNGKTISAVRSGSRSDCCVNSYKFASTVYKRSSTVTRIYVRIGLNKRLQWENLVGRIVMQYVDVSRFSANNSRCNCRSKVKGISNCKDPFTNL